MDPKQHHFLLSQLFGQHLEAEEHVGGRNSIKGMRRKEYPMETIFHHLGRNAQHFKP